MSYFLGRPREKGRIDLFLSLFSPDAAELLEAIRGFKPVLHFLCVDNGGKFEAAKGTAEVEECLRSVCVQKYYPDSFWNYVTCRAKNTASSWWEDCLPQGDYQKVMACAKGPEGAALLRENIRLNKELSVMFGPTYLRDNYEIFSSQGTPSEAEFDKIFKDKTR